MTHTENGKGRSDTPGSSTTDVCKNVPEPQSRSRKRGISKHLRGLNVGFKGSILACAVNCSFLCYGELYCMRSVVDWLALECVLPRLYIHFCVSNFSNVLYKWCLCF